MSSLAHPSSAPLTVAPGVKESLASHEWPGNVRELRNVLERAAYLARASGSTDLQLGAIPFAAVRPPSASVVEGTSPSFDSSKSYRETKTEWEESFEKQYVSWLLERHGGNISA